MNIFLVRSEGDWDSIKKLFQEYFVWVSRDQGIDLGFQGIEDELNSLPGPYAPPDGCLLMAEIEGQAAGCVAIRRLDGETCEMKRMYVRPEFRAQGVGRALGEQIVREAQKRGYRRMRLDTANTMMAAQGLYRSLGFKPINPYYELPPDILQRAVFMELVLQ